MSTKINTKEGHIGHQPLFLISVSGLLWATGVDSSPVNHMYSVVGKARDKLLCCDTLVGGSKGRGLDRGVNDKALRHDLGIAHSKSTPLLCIAAKYHLGEFVKVPLFLSLLEKLDRLKPVHHFGDTLVHKAIHDHILRHGQCERSLRVLMDPASNNSTSSSVDHVKRESAVFQRQHGYKCRYEVFAQHRSIANSTAGCLYPSIMRTCCSHFNHCFAILCEIDKPRLLLFHLAFLHLDAPPLRDSRLLVHGIEHSRLGTVFSRSR
mmetsp:Transcript_41438/g.107357  ORF Transcript_41438/g.107357 Transcript_41438/m.107357 type:complete len:264 (-) Transcript_41438:1760-2551(-)